MGFRDAAANLRALCETNGDVFKAVAVLNSSQGPSAPAVAVGAVGLAAAAGGAAAFASSRRACFIVMFYLLCFYYVFDDQSSVG